MNVLYGAHIESEFHIDMALKFEEEHGTEGNHIPIIHHVTSDIMLLAIIRATILWVSILIDRSFLPKGFGKVFGTLAILHARCIGVLGSTGPMGHELTHQFVQSGMGLLIWKGSRDH